MCVCLYVSWMTHRNAREYMFAVLKMRAVSAFFSSTQSLSHQRLNFINQTLVHSAYGTTKKWERLSNNGTHELLYQYRVQVFVINKHNSS